MAKIFPCFTVCPWPAFRTLGFHYSKEQFEKETFTVEDLLTETYNDMEYLNVKVTKSITLGKCFTIKIAKPVRVNEPFILFLKRTWDVVIFVHNDGDEFWLSWSMYPPPSMQKFELTIKTGMDSAMTELRVAEKQLELISKHSRPCLVTNSDGPEDLFMKAEEEHR